MVWCGEFSALRMMKESHEYFALTLHLRDWMFTIWEGWGRIVPLLTITRMGSYKSRLDEPSKTSRVEKMNLESTQGHGQNALNSRSDLPTPMVNTPPTRLASPRERFNTTIITVSNPSLLERERVLRRTKLESSQSPEASCNLTLNYGSSDLPEGPGSRCNNPPSGSYEKATLNRRGPAQFW